MLKRINQKSDARFSRIFTDFPVNKPQTDRFFQRYWSILPLESTPSALSIVGFAFCDGEGIFGSSSVVLWDTVIWCLGWTSASSGEIEETRGPDSDSSVKSGSISTRKRLVLILVVLILQVNKKCREDKKIKNK